MSHMAAVVSAILVIASGAIGLEDFGELAPPSGYPVANFGIAAEVSTTGRVLSRLLVNPPVLGPWLSDLGIGRLCVRSDGVELATEAFARRNIERLWPMATLELSDDRLPGILVSIRVWSPVVRGDALATSLPVVYVDCFVRNDGAEDRRIDLTLQVQPESDWLGGQWRPEGRCFGCDAFALGWDAPDDLLLGTDLSSFAAPVHLALKLSVPAGAEAPARFVVGAFHPDGYYTTVADDARELVAYALGAGDDLFEATDATAALLPSLGDEKLDTYCRWYTAAGVMLTRLTRRNEVLTMGYCELNQRDSFWTSFVHLVFWPALERRMIAESAEAQGENGKIPTTILPLIERNDDIDINLYFCLRVHRYWSWTRDDGFARMLMPVYEKAIGFVAGLDTDGDGVPEQGSYWADWKDVAGVEGRKWGPHFVLLYAAALRSGAEMAAHFGDDAAANAWRERADTVIGVANVRLHDGGMWTGTHYANVWRGQHRDGHVLQDQVIPAIWGVFPPGRLEKVYNTLGHNETEWGVRETYPYYDEETFGLQGGDYHNGSIWPWLTFADALGRFVNGYPADAERIMRNTGWGDLEWHGDWLPHENVHGETGESTHKPIQAWNADYFGAVFFGGLGVSRRADGTLVLAPRVPLQRRVDTALVLPDGVLHFRQEPDGVATAVRFRWEGHAPLTLRYGAMVDPHRKYAERVGQIGVAWQDPLVLAPGESAELDMERP